jgi:phage terminase large subunit-like protein
LFQGQNVERFNIRLGMPASFWREVGCTIYMGVDFAISSTVGADYTAIVVMGSDSAGNRWVIDIHREKGMPYHRQLSLINQVARKYDPALVLLESNQMQRIFGDELIRTSDLPIKKFTTGVQKHTLDKGIPSLRILLENGKVRIPRGDAHSVEMTDILATELRSFTYIDGKLTSTGGHDDVAMAYYICDQAVRMGGFTFSFGEEKGMGEESMDDLMKEFTGEENDSNTGESTNTTMPDARETHPAIKNGCTQDLSSVMASIVDGEDPCMDCEEDRAVCRGRHGGGGRSGPILF